MLTRIDLINTLEQRLKTLTAANGFNAVRNIGDKVIYKTGPADDDESDHISFDDGEEEYVRTGTGRSLDRTLTVDLTAVLFAKYNGDKLEDRGRLAAGCLDDLLRWARENAALGGGATLEVANSDTLVNLVGHQVVVVLVELRVKYRTDLLI